MPNAPGCPMTRAAVTDAYFLEHRAKLLDIAAFLDRLDRAGGEGDDFRIAAFRSALPILTRDQPDRARRVLEHFSDPSTDPVAAAPMKGATGAHDSGGSA